jgi:hypothetical protein
MFYSIFWHVHMISVSHTLLLLVWSMSVSIRMWKCFTEAQWFNIFCTAKWWKEILFYSNWRWGTIKCSKEHVSILCKLLCKFHFAHQEDTRCQQKSVVHLCHLWLTLHLSENANYKIYLHLCKCVRFMFVYVRINVEHGPCKCMCKIIYVM